MGALDISWGFLKSVTIKKMFCPQCGNLSYVNQAKDIICSNTECGYRGPAMSEMTLPPSVGGGKVDLAQTISEGKEPPNLSHLQTIVGNDVPTGTLRQGVVCKDDKCDGREAYVEVKQIRASDEAETKFMTCAKCGKRWSEHQ